MLTDPEGSQQTLELDWLFPVLPIAAASSSEASAEVEDATSAGLLRATTDGVSAGTPSSTVKKEPLNQKGFRQKRQTLRQLVLILH